MFRELNEQEYKEQFLPEHSDYVIVFHATWCPPCRLFKSTLEELSEKDGINVVRIDTDKNRMLSNEFGIKTLPTWFIIKGGEVVEKGSGYMLYAEFQTIVKKHL
ncbi:thioredoxin [Mycoplasmopsis mucosicanis]|uniref:Thioredoxin n=1 Tax=Mycoplasmopsis mucosicanis TaxID=458208 RepID=A0A507SXM6_9BACT|nr:thioredoxin family protein [Mycoplasmopsis mucosicanis]TQC54012.1 thioredoxin [Mycoplasmopsis mucosicanis]